jgi:hypothetical protein
VPFGCAVVSGSGRSPPNYHAALWPYIWISRAKSPVLSSRRRIVGLRLQTWPRRQRARSNSGPAGLNPPLPRRQAIAGQKERRARARRQEGGKGWSPENQALAHFLRACRGRRPRLRDRRPRVRANRFAGYEANWGEANAHVSIGVFTADTAPRHQLFPSEDTPSVDMPSEDTVAVDRAEGRSPWAESSGNFAPVGDRVPVGSTDWRCYRRKTPPPSRGAAGLSNSPEEPTVHRPKPVGRLPGTFGQVVARSIEERSMEEPDPAPWCTVSTPALRD